MKKHLLAVLFCIFVQQGFSQFTVSQITYAPDSFNLGTQIPVVDDQFSAVIQMPFSFCFFGNVYNSLIVGANGIVSFNTASANGYCQWPITAAIPSTTMPTNCIMMPMQDLYSSSGTYFYYNTYGSAPNRRFVISIYQSPMYSCLSQLFTGEVMLYETSNTIEIHIQRKGICISWNGGYAVEGVHNANGTQAFVVPGRNYPTQWSAANDAWRFTPNSCPTGIENVSNQNALNIFPNPASGEIHLSFTGTGSELFSVELADVSGRIVYRDNVSGQKERIIHPDVPAGIYFVRVLNKSGEQIAVKKLAIQ